MAKKKQKNCSQCKEKNYRWYGDGYNNRTICLGCAVEKGNSSTMASSNSHV